MENKNNKVIQEFGDEWTIFNYSKIDKKKLKQNFNEYFSIVSSNFFSKKSIGFDMGCGSGRWAQFVAPKVKQLNCVDPSNAIFIAQKNLKRFKNITYFKETTEMCSIKKKSQDFGYSLGVLHHIPNTQQALIDCSKLLKKKAPLLVYIYYNFENKPLWFKLTWILSDYLRKLISSLPKSLKMFFCNLIAFIIYYPLSRASFYFEKIGFNFENIPLSEYRHKSFYQCRNDALDRFGTRLEQRFSKSQILKMLKKAGFENTKFSSKPPYWCFITFKKK
jgi:2-polyprenyl-3-methyl-5-hydroxy-6-metoxy-1,4-benzoquinol methylase